MKAIASLHQSFNESNDTHIFCGIINFSCYTFCREAGANYRSMIGSGEFNDTSLWTHKWALNFQARRRSVELKRADQFIEWYVLI